MNARLRRAIGVVACVVLGVTAPASVAAAPPDRGTEEVLRVACETPLASGDDTLVLYEAISSSRFGSFGTIEAWLDGADPETDPPTIGGQFGEATGSISGSRLVVSFDVVELATELVVGRATIDATLTGTGDVETIDDRFDFANRFERLTGTVETATVAGTVTLDLEGDDDPVFALEGCEGEIVSLEFFATQPTAFVDAPNGIELHCVWESDEGFVQLDAIVFDDGFTFASLFVDPQLIGGQVEEMLLLTEEGGTFDIPLFDLDGPLDDPAVVDATFVEAGTEVERLTRGFGWEKFVYTMYEVEGTLTVPDADLVLDLAVCDAFSFEGRVKFGESQGPKGKPAPNDDPSGAITVVSGTRLQTTNVGTAFEPEEPASCLLDDPEFGPQFGSTLWYQLVGTGETVTIDTAGSHFDTAIVVYEVSGDELVEVACVDDVPTGDLARTIAARVELDTEAGTVYLIQVGGFAGDADRLRLVID